MTNARIAALKAAAYLDTAAVALRKAHNNLDAVKPELGRKGRALLKRLQVARNEAFALSIDVIEAGQP